MLSILPCASQLPASSLWLLLYCLQSFPLIHFGRFWPLFYSLRSFPQTYFAHCYILFRALDDQVIIIDWISTTTLVRKVTKRVSDKPPRSTLHQGAFFLLKCLMSWTRVFIFMRHCLILLHVWPWILYWHIFCFTLSAGQSTLLWIDSCGCILNVMCHASHLVIRYDFSSR